MKSEVRSRKPESACRPPLAARLSLVAGCLLLPCFLFGASTTWNSFEVTRQTARQLDVRVTMSAEDELHDSVVACARFVAVPRGTQPTITATRVESLLVRDAGRTGAADPELPLVSLGEPVQFRDLYLVPVVVRHLRNDVQAGTTVAYSRVDLRVEIPAGAICPRKIAPAFAELYRSVLNFDPNGTHPAREGFLMVVPDAFYDNALPLARWKELEGYQVCLKRKSEVGSSNTEIRNYVANAYHTWPIPPTYVLLIGTINQIPAFNIPGPGVITDHNYACIDGNDFFPEVLIGRLPVNSSSMLDYLTQKIFTYERTPYVADTTWYHQAMMVATTYQQGATPTITALETKRWVANLIAQHGFTRVDTIFDPPYSNGVGPVDTAVNRGVCLINGRGWGNPQGWAYPAFQIANVYNLANGWKQPVITSLYCGTGAFNANPCFGEAWLQAGSPSEPKGAVGFFGASFSGTSTRWNNCLDYGIYHGIFNEGITDFGSAMLRGKLEIFENFPMPADTYYLRVYWYTYNILGDPSLRLWTGSVPKTLDVMVQSPVLIGANRVMVSTAQTTGAKVSLVQGSATHVVGYTGSAGDIELGVPSLTGETLFVTVTRAGFAPSESFYIPQPSAVFVAPESQSPDTCNPGAGVDLMVGLRNFGTSQTATGVQAVLRSSDPWVLVTDSVKGFGDIAPGTSVQGGPFALQVSPSCTSGHRLSFDLSVSSGAAVWTSGVTLVARPGGVTYTRHSGDPAPGQAVDVVVRLRNSGARDLTNISGMLVSTSSGMIVEDASGLFGSIAQGDSGSNAGDVFRVRTKPDMAAGRRVGFNLVLQGDNGFSQVVRFDVAAGAAVATVPMGPDAYGYYAYDDVDAGYPEQPAYSWVEIDPGQGGAGTRLELENDDTKVIGLPFSFRYYGLDYNRVSVCDNGFLAGDSTVEHSIYNWRIPSAYGPPNIIAPMWDDFRPDTAGASGVYYYDDAGSHRFIVEWSRVAHVHGFNPPIIAELQTFEVVLSDPAFNPTQTGDGEILFQYKTVLNDDSAPGNCHNRATVGIGNRDHRVGLQCTFADSLSPAAAPLTAGRAIKFTTDAPDTFTGIREQGAGDETPEVLDAFPSPNAGGFAIRYRLPGFSAGTVRLFDAAGRQVASWPVAGTGRIVVPKSGDRSCPDLPSGVYLLSLTANPGGRIITFTSKLVVSRRNS